MANISGWEKFRKAVTGSYSEKLSYELAREKAAEKAAALAIEKTKLEVAAKRKALQEEVESARVAKVKADAAKTPSQPVVKKPAAKKVVAFDPNAKDGDGDGKLQDGTIHERPALPKKPAAKKTTPKPKPKK